jgi:hypothetical protein
MTSEWLREQIDKLERELINADVLVIETSHAFRKAEIAYTEAKEAAKTIAGCIRGLKEELDYTSKRELEVWNESLIKF